MGQPVIPVHAAKRTEFRRHVPASVHRNPLAKTASVSGSSVLCNDHAPLIVPTAAIESHHALASERNQPTNAPQKAAKIAALRTVNNSTRFIFIRLARLVGLVLPDTDAKMLNFRNVFLAPGIPAHAFQVYHSCHLLLHMFCCSCGDATRGSRR